METIKGQCFDCYSDSNFRYFGQTGNYDERQSSLDYVSKLNKPSTVVECVTCGRSVEYKEYGGKWIPTVLGQQMG